MFEMHDIIEGWLLDSTEGALAPWKSRFMRGHLAGCTRCQGFALGLIEFSHDVETVPRKERLSASDAALLHSQVMAAVSRERSAELDAAPAPKLHLRTYFGVRPQFAKAMGLILLVLGALVMLSRPAPQSSSSTAFNAAPRAKAIDLMPSPEPSPTATPFPKPTPAN